MKFDIVIAVLGGMVWGVFVGYAYAGVGNESAVLVGFLYGAGWAVLWMALSLIREAVRKRRSNR